MARTTRMTIAEAALGLNVGDDFVLRLIKLGELAAVERDGEYTLDAATVAAFKRTRDVERRNGLRELTRMTEEFGGYDHER